MLIREAGLALMLLTRLPVARLVGPDPVPPARAVWAFPLAGALAGAVGSLVLAGGAALGIPAPLAACWAVGATVAVGGALHEDGLADLADGFGGGATPERKLAIMRDSRIGSYGAIALILSTGIRIVGAAALVDRPTALIAVGALSRGGIAVPLLLLRPARDGGLGALVAGAGARRWACFLLAAALAIATLPHPAVPCLAALAAALLVSLLARAQIGGFTGDVLGACAVAAECATLSALACT